MKILKTFLALSFFVPLIASAQDPQFTQTMANPMYFNPAFAGIQQNFRASLQYKIQSGDFIGETTNTILSAEIGAPKINSGFGITGMHGVTGVNILLNTSALAAYYAYEFKLDANLFLRAGLAGSLTQHITDLSGLRFGSSIDPKTGFKPDTVPGSTVTDLNLAGGIVLYGDKFYGGLSVYNILPTKPQFGVLPEQKSVQRFDAQVGSFFKFDEFSINPSIILMRAGVNGEAMAGINFSNGMFTAGSSFRFSDVNTINFLIGFTKGKFKLCYSYDHPSTTSKNRIFFDGSHEFSLVFQLSKPNDTSAKPMIANMRNAF